MQDSLATDAAMYYHTTYKTGYDSDVADLSSDCPFQEKFGDFEIIFSRYCNRNEYPVTA